MRTWLQEWTPVQLLWIIAASNFLVAIGFGMMAFPARFHHGSRALLLCPLVVLLLGLIGDLIVENDLKEGIASERWADALLNGPRKLAPAFFGLSYLFIAVSFISVLIMGASGRMNFSGAWCFLFPAMCLTRLANYLRPKSASSNDSLFKPIERPRPLQSEEWGTPPRPFSN
jgi:hypothetical protein